MKSCCRYRNVKAALTMSGVGPPGRVAAASAVGRPRRESWCWGVQHFCRFRKCFQHLCSKRAGVRAVEITCAVPSQRVVAGNLSMRSAKLRFSVIVWGEVDVKI